MTLSGQRCAKSRLLPSSSACGPPTKVMKRLTVLVTGIRQLQEELGPQCSPLTQPLPQRRNSATLQMQSTGRLDHLPAKLRRIIIHTDHKQQGAPVADWLVQQQPGRAQGS